MTSLVMVWGLESPSQESGFIGLRDIYDISSIVIGGKSPLFKSYCIFLPYDLPSHNMAMRPPTREMSCLRVGYSRSSLEIT
jgi:hypothetical protein